MSVSDRPYGKTICPCGAAWLGTIDHGMAEQRSHAEFRASGGETGPTHDPGLATFTPDTPAAPAPQSLRDAALPCGHRFPSNGGRCYGSAAWHDGEKGKHAYLPVDRRSGRDRRAALDAPALTVERLAEALHDVQGGRYESWLKRAPLILRALGEGAAE